MKTGIALPMKIQIEDSFIIQPSDDSGVVMNADSFDSENDYDEENFQLINESENLEFPRMRYSNSKQSPIIINKFESDKKEILNQDYQSNTLFELTHHQSPTVPCKLVTPETYNKKLKGENDLNSSPRDLVYHSKLASKEKYSSIALADTARADLPSLKIDDTRPKKTEKTSIIDSSTIGRFRKAYDEFSKCMNKDFRQHKTFNSNGIAEKSSNTKLTSSKSQSNFK